MTRALRSPILVLSEDLASQIAAGEVVQRPANVVKELIENALDAAAARIEVSIEAGGIGLIRVSDDGRGIHEQDVRLCLLRHATSKLRRVEDLEVLDSFGFRGEALPSIASVSRLHIETRHGESESGSSVQAEGTTEPSLRPTGHPVGTTVSVRDLFYNVPARRKFLKSSNTEAGHVADVVVAAALSRPDVGFFLKRDGRTVRKFERVDTTRKRVEQVLPDEALESIEGARGPLRVEAFLSRPGRSTRGAGALHFFVNGRPVKDRALAATLAHAYGPALDKGRYPRGVVFLSLPTRLVDVNVHPQKTEVRFADARAVCDALYSCVARGLGAARHGAPGHASSPQAALQAAPQQAAPQQAAVVGEGPLDAAGAGSPEGRARSRMEHFSFRSPREAPVGSSARGFGGAGARGPGGDGTPARAGVGRAVAGRPVAPSLPGGPPSADQETSLGHGSGVRSSGRSRTALRLLGQARDGFLVCQSARAIVTLDQHAADEVGIYARLQESYRTGGIGGQSLLFPHPVQSSQGDRKRLERRAALLLRLGLDLRFEESITLHTVPAILERTGPERLLLAFLAATRSERDELAIVDQFFAQVACLEAVPRGRGLSTVDATQIIRALPGPEVIASMACPHRQIVLHEVTFERLDGELGEGDDT